MYNTRYIALCLLGLILLVAVISIVDKATGDGDSEFFNVFTILISMLYAFVCVSLPRQDIRDRA